MPLRTVNKQQCAYQKTRVKSLAPLPLDDTVTCSLGRREVSLAFLARDIRSTAAHLLRLVATMVLVVLGGFLRINTGHVMICSVSAVHMCIGWCEVQVRRSKQDRDLREVPLPAWRKERCRCSAFCLTSNINITMLCIFQRLQPRRTRTPVC